MSWDGRSGGPIAGSATVTISNGSGTITHGKSTAPLFAAAAVYTSSFYVAFVPEYTATTLTVSLRQVTNGANAPDGTYPIRWWGVWA
ncbi:hypothetical protein ACFVJS_03765 [Nocardioides sp. NPDC057772]|uniref:hypothetical protein n=1 Tax=Nocardioides sp. NPDC057772 TaxID=3346245 RepID=UPI00366DD0CE